MTSTLQRDPREAIRQNVKLLMSASEIDTEAELSRRSGLNQQTVSRILKGGTGNPGVETLLPLANTLGVTISQLIGEMPIESTKSVEMTPQQLIQVPIVYWEQVKDWENIVPNKSLGNWPDWAFTTVATSKFAYALKVKAKSYAPIFPINTILIVDPEVDPIDGDYVIVQSKKSEQAALKKVFIEGDIWLHSLLPDHLPERLSTAQALCGVVLQSMTPHRKE